MLLYDEVREPRVYHAILQAIGAGAHTLDEIANLALVGKTHLSSYLARLQELRFVERRLPITAPPARRARSRAGRYHLTVVGPPRAPLFGACEPSTPFGPAPCGRSPSGRTACGSGQV